MEKKLKLISKTIAIALCNSIKQSSFLELDQRINQSDLISNEKNSVVEKFVKKSPSLKQINIDAEERSIWK